MKSFQRNIEDFECGNCGAEVKGDGYTNHCPKCLWSRDVDINPGDRASGCGGMMRPVGIETAAGGFVIIHECEKCGKRKRNKSAEGDDFDEMLKIQSCAVRRTTRKE
ncbi:MAG: RNHCP domain-containing protein [Rickettsiales bacterium]|nr:RNHCP domain-containing protein [Rickettsiales bacterium]